MDNKKMFGCPELKKIIGYSLFGFWISISHIHDYFIILLNPFLDRPFQKELGLSKIHYGYLKMIFGEINNTMVLQISVIWVIKLSVSCRLTRPK